MKNIFSSAWEMVTAQCIVNRKWLNIMMQPLKKKKALISALKALNVEKASAKLTTMITLKYNVMEVSKRTWWLADCFKCILTVFIIV